MKKRTFLFAMLALSLSVISCEKIDEFDDQDDNKNDDNVQTSTVLFINELAGSDDFVEIYNASDEPIDLGGYQVNDDDFNADEYYNIPAGTIIPAKGFYFFSKEDLEEKGLAVFGISGDGDEVTLYDKAGNIISKVEIPEENGASYGRTEDGGNNFQWFTVASPGKSNSGNTEPNPDPDQPGVSDIKGIFINEVHPDGEPQDWVEIYNMNSESINISGFLLCDDKGTEDDDAFIIPEGTIIEKGAFLILESFAFGIGKSGDQISLYDTKGDLVDAIAIPEYLDDNKSYSRISDGSSIWEYREASKGTTNNNESSSILINEVFTYGDQKTIEALDWIELYNTTSESMDLSGMKLWEGGGAEEAWLFPQGTKIAAKSYLVIKCDKEELLEDPINNPIWGLSKGPDEIVVLADSENNIIDMVSCPSLIENESYGRENDGSSKWVIFKSSTMNAENAGDLRPSHNMSSTIFINEVQHDGDDEATEPWRQRDYIELYNSTSNPTDISGWKMYDDKGEDVFTIPAGTIIQANGFVTFETLEDKLGDANDGTRFDFGLGKSGDWVYLYNQNGRDKNDIYKNLVDIIEVPSFSDLYEGMGYTFGRAEDGSTKLAIFSEQSKNASNSGKKIISSI